DALSTNAGHRVLEAGRALYMMSLYSAILNNSRRATGGQRTVRGTARDHLSEEWQDREKAPPRSPTRGPGADQGSRPDGICSQRRLDQRAFRIIESERFPAIPDKPVQICRALRLQGLNFLNEVV